MTLSKKTLGGDDGLTDASWTVRRGFRPDLIFTGKLYAEGTLTIALYHDVADPEKDPPLDAFGNTTGAHERTHAQYNKDWWNGMADEVNKLSGWYCGKCKDLAPQLSEAIYEYYLASSRVDNERFDEDAYGGHGTLSSLEGDKATKKSEYDRLWIEFRANKCE